MLQVFLYPALPSARTQAKASAAREKDRQAEKEHLGIPFDGNDSISLYSII